MMDFVEAMQLQPGEYPGTYKLVGGRTSLDFINTVSWPGSDREHDWLDSAENLQRWLRAVGLTAAKVKNPDLKAVAQLRTDLADVLRPLAHREKPSRAAVVELNQLIEKASARRGIDAADVIASDHERLRYCPSCDWRFEDQTRNGQRRWCDMADCGSRDKARRYYRRVQKAGA